MSTGLAVIVVASLAFDQSVKRDAGKNGLWRGRPGL